MNHTIQLTEQQRIEAYQHGWNDAMAARDPAIDQPIMYWIGYGDAARDHAPRYNVETIEVHAQAFGRVARPAATPWALVDGELVKGQS